MVADLEAGALLGQNVEVTSSAEHTEIGRLVRIHNAAVVAAVPVVGTYTRPSADVAELLASAPGPDPQGVTGLSEEEADGFLKAIGV